MLREVSPTQVDKKTNTNSRIIGIPGLLWFLGEITSLTPFSGFSCSSPD